MTDMKGRRRAVLAPMLILFVSFWVVRLPVAVIASKFWGVDGIWWSSPIGNVANVAMAWLYYRYGNWRSIRLFDRSESRLSAQVASPSEI